MRVGGGPGWRVPGYLLERELGRGGSSEVWQARSVTTGEPVALKRVPVTDADQLRRARAEGVLLQALDHPNLVRLRDVVVQADAVVLVLDLADAGTLSELVARRGRLTPGETVAALAPIAGAVAHAHTHGIVHGDLSPANVLFTSEGLSLLADLGVARVVGDPGPARCTPAFVDPAVAAGGVPAAPGDVFGLAGLTLFALTGEPLWPGATAAQALTAACSGRVVDVTARLAALPVPAELIAVLERALDRQPHRRGTAADFALDLRHAAEPVAVELTAGRAAPSAITGSFGPASFGAGSSAAVSLRPDPSADPADAGYAASPALTHGARVRHLAVRPPRRARVVERLLRVRLPARGTLVGVLTLGVLAAVCALVLTRGHPGSQAAADRPASSSAASHRAQAAPSPPRMPTTAPATPTTAPSTVASVRAALAALDTTRADAFARRAPALLARVYVAGPLLAQDRALLARVVPAGCGLHGARTTYTSLRVGRRDPRRITVTVSASLAASTLVCGGSERGHAAAVPPTRLQIELVTVAGGYRIAAQHRF